MLKLKPFRSFSQGYITISTPQEFRKFTSRDGESLESYYSRFYKMMNELVRNQCDVTKHKVNVQFLLQLQPECQRAERLAHTANPLTLVAQQQPVYYPRNHPTHYTQHSSTRSQQAATRNRGKAIVNPPSLIYDQKPSMVAEDDEMSKDKEIDKLMALIFLSFKKIYKPTNNNLRTSSNTSRVNQDNSLRINRGIWYDNQRIVNVTGARETVEQADWRDDTDDDPEDQELEAHYMYMAQIQEVLLLAWDRVFKIKDAFGNEQYKPEDIQELFRKLLDDLQNIHVALAEYINSLGWDRPAIYDDDDDDDDLDYACAITPVLSTEEPDNSLSMGDEHLDIISATKSNEVIKSNVEDLVPIPSESEGIPDTMCDVHLVNNPTPLEAKDHFEIIINSNDDYSSSDNDSLYNENIEYVEASPHDSELVILEVAEIVIPEDEEIEDDNLREKLLNVNLLITKIEALKDNPTLSSKFLTKSSSTSPKSFLNETNTFDKSLPEFENFCFDLEEISSGSTTTHSDISLSDYEAFYFYDNIKEISSGNTTTHSDISLSEYDSFIFDLSNDQFCPSDRIEDDHSPLLAYVVWIFLAYLTVFEIKDAFGNKQYKPEDMQEFLCKLFNDVQNIHEELAEYINTPGWNRPSFYDDDDDDDWLAKKNELKARGTLLMALPDKHQLKFNIHKDAKTLMEAIEKRFGGNKETKKVQKTLLKQQYENFTGSSSKTYLLNGGLILSFGGTRQIWKNKTDLEEQSLDDLFNSLKIYKAEVKSYSSARTSIQNIAFVSSQNTGSTNEPVSAVASVSAAISNSPQSDNDSLKQIDADDLEEMDLKWQMAMLTVRERRFLQRTRRNLRANRPTSMGFDMSKVECYNCHKKGHFAKVSMTRAFRQKKNQPTMPSWRSPPQVILVLTMRDNALVIIRQKIKKAKQERDELQLKLEKFQTSSKNLSQLLASQTNDKNVLGYNNQVFPSSMFDCDEMFNFETDECLPASPIYDRYHSGEGYHAIPSPYTGTFMPPKPDLVFHDAPNVNETIHTAFNVELSLTKPEKDMSHTHRPSAPIIKDWVSDSKDDSEAAFSQNVPSFVQPYEQVKIPRPSVKPLENSIPDANPKTDIPKPQTYKTSKTRKACFVLLTKSKLVPLTAARPVTTAVPQPHVTSPRPTKTVVTKPVSPPRRTINRRPSPPASNFPSKVTAAKTPKHTLKDKGVIYSGCSRHMIGNMSYLSDFEEINGGYVAFGGNPKGGKITGKDTECIVLSLESKPFDENQVLLRVPRENNMYNMDLKNIVPSRDLTCLFAKVILDESNRWHRRLGHINFKTMNKLVKGTLSLTQFDNSLILGEGFKIRDNHLWEYLGNGEWSSPTGLKLA
nr:hypothetical protein [Tanacetum cinerariifolium]